MTGKLKTALLGGTLVFAMGGLGFASVPLYRLFCEVTGLEGTTQRSLQAPGATGKSVTVAFDSNVAGNLGWEFRPEARTQKVDIGARTMAFYVTRNHAGKPVTGRATFNVTPNSAGKYFAKIECFCFTEQTLKAGETVRMPVLYYVDPAILTDPDTRDIREITLSYTFYPVDSGKTAS